jgi:8-oxo-dGTP pyrophosphatase MutT (NUDIX family)
VPTLDAITPDELARRLAARTRDAATLPGRPAAVLAALSRHSDGPHVLLTKRTEGLRTHGGQYALPGGRADPDDDSAVATALREAHEEVGIDPADVRVLGLLDDQRTTSGYVVTPVVGWIRHPYPFRLSPDEVALALELPLRAFVAPPRPRTLLAAGLRRLVPSFDVGGHVIWGATARILRNLAVVIAA